MAYTQNPNVPKVRRDAVNLVKYRGWSMRKVALRYGVEPSTVSRWCKRDRCGGFRLISTQSSAPKTHPNALSKEIVRKIIAKRIGRRRCGQVIHQELLREGIKVSLSSVHRTLDRLNLLKKRSVWKRPHDWTPRPIPAFAGALIEVDTVHIHAPDGSRIYVYTLIDIFSRWAYAEIGNNLLARSAANFVLRAEKRAPFKFQMIQTDHGSEFSTRFSHALKNRGINHRHSRVRQKDDQAHIERFNRTIQEECFDQAAHTIPDFKKALKEYLPYYNNERLHMGINYQTPLEVLQRCWG
jgi:transposase InsO family protein